MRAIKSSFGKGLSVAIAILSAFFLLFVARPALASHVTGHIDPPGQSGSFLNPLQFTSLDQFLTALLEVIIQIGFPIVVLAIIWTGFLFVKARGDVEGLKEARRAFFWTLIGALLVLGAFVLSELIQSTVNEIT